MTSGNALTREERLQLAKAAHDRYGLQFDHKDLVFLERGPLAGPEPVWFDMPGQDRHESEREARKVQRTGRGNSATFALLESFARAYKEPRLFVWRGPFMDLDNAERLDDHPLTRARGLLRVPNPMAKLTMSQLKPAIAKGKLVGGQFYLVKARTGGGDITTNVTGAVARLWPVWSTRMRPAVYDKSDGIPSNGWIDYYAYETGRGKPLRVPVENVIHFRNGLRDDDPRLGIGIVEEFAREVATDIEASMLVQAVMSNLGMPGLVISPDFPAGGATPATSQGGIRKDDRDELKASVMARTTGRRRGEPIVFSRPTKVEQFKADLQSLNLEHVWQHVESRISAVVGWPAILAGLQVGLEEMSYATASALRRFATENTTVPTWGDDSETWTLELGPDFGLRDDEFIAYDYRSIRALQEDRNDMWKRVGEAWGRNELTIGQHHRLLDLELPEGVDENLRKAEVEASAQLSRLLGPALGKSRSFVIDGSVVRSAPLLIDGKAVERYTPPSDLDDTADKAELDEGTDFTEDDLAAAIADEEARIAELDPDMAGILGAETEEDEADDGAKAKPPASWKFEPGSQRYRWPNTGRLVPEDRVFKLRERLIAESGGRMRDIAQGHLDGDYSVRQMQKRMRAELADRHLSMRALGRGGEKGVTRADRSAVGDMVKRENRYLSRFGRDVAHGKLTEAEILTRAEAYAGGSMRQTFAEARTVGHKGAGYTHKERVTKSGAPCTTCQDEAGAGRVAIDEPGWVIGGTECKHADQCELLFHKEA